MTVDYTSFVFGLVLCALGVWEAVVARRKRRRDQQWLDAAVTTEGVIWRTVERKDYSGPSDSFDNIQVSDVRMVRFRTPDGQEYECDAPPSSGNVGDKIAVIYNPAQPSDARVPNRNAYRGGCGYILFALGLFLAYRAFSG